MNRKSTVPYLLLILLLTSCIVFVGTVSAAIPKPSVPEFTLEYINNSYNMPSTTSTKIDPFSGETTSSTSPSYRVDNRTIEVTIKNQPFTPDSSDPTITLSYTIRFKGHYAQDWTTLFDPDTCIESSVSGYTVQTTPDSTKYTFKIGESGDAFGWEINRGGEVDFQVQALFGSVHRDASQLLAPLVFDGEKSGWSNTQTITIPPNPINQPSVTAQPSQFPIQNSTLTQQQPGTQQEAQYNLDLIRIIIVALLVVITMLLIFVVMRLQKRTSK